MNVAVVDIGSNSTRLLIAGVEDHRVTELVRRSQVTRLGAGVDADGRLREDAMQRVFETLERYRAEIDQHDCEQAVAVLTSAVRDSANGREFAGRVRDQYGLAPHVLTGDEEAQLTFLGATSERDGSDRTPTLVLDIGGGSTELVIGCGRDVVFHVSTQAGVVRQTERHLHHDPPERGELAELGEDVRGILAAGVPAERRHSVRQGIAVAGTATSLAAIAQDLDPYDPEKVQGYMLSAGESDRILARLSKMTLEERRHVTGLHPDRAPTIVAGIVIFRQALSLFGLDQIEISEHDILRGAALLQAAGGL
ncbi:MAG TPA: Ppx/GppA phosphatase family protein [Solirubrobacteraceae bacterium]|jgi:exopolyphosphatase/guanosine-5'-triphosphate,3'-diphosphate pyrophosphatase|nr:Ppx/GppA phosphatase family protein [Solirubrobacteraceae bacterium]